MSGVCESLLFYSLIWDFGRKGLSSKDDSKWNTQGSHAQEKSYGKEAHDLEVQKWDQTQGGGVPQIEFGKREGVMAKKCH